MRESVSEWKEWVNTEEAARERMCEGSDNVTGETTPAGQTSCSWKQLEQHPPSRQHAAKHHALAELSTASDCSSRLLRASTAAAMPCCVQLKSCKNSCQHERNRGACKGSEKRQ